MRNHRITHGLATRTWWWFLYRCSTYPNQPTDQPPIPAWGRQNKTIQARTSLGLFLSFLLDHLALLAVWSQGNFISPCLCNSLAFLDVCQWLPGRVRDPTVAQMNTCNEWATNLIWWLRRIISDTSSLQAASWHDSLPPVCFHFYSQYFTTFPQSHPFLNGL